MISKKEVRHIAKLARLDLNEDETRRFQKELCSILDYVGKLKEIDREIAELAPTNHFIGKSDFMRTDEVRSSSTPDDMPEKLMNLASQKEKGYLKVKSILK